MSKQAKTAKKNKPSEAKVLVIIVIGTLLISGGFVTYKLYKDSNSKNDGITVPAPPPVPKNDPNAGQESIEIFPVPPEEADGDQPKLPSIG